MSRLRRPQTLPPRHLAITGSMGMGKSTTAQMFSAHGFPLYDADAEVHALYRPGGRAVKPVGDAFPQALDAQGGIDRAVLRRLTTGDGAQMRRLESVVHPLLAASRNAFMQAARPAPAVIFDIPLLFETGGERQMDHVIVASAPEAVQWERLLRRHTMEAAALRRMLARQRSDEEKRRHADFIVETGRGMADARAQVARIVKQLHLA